MYHSFAHSAEILKLRQSSKNDKKKRKEANAKIDEFEKALAKRHQQELEEFRKMETLTKV